MTTRLQSMLVGKKALSSSLLASARTSLLSVLLCNGVSDRDGWAKRIAPTDSPSQGLIFELVVAVDVGVVLGVTVSVLVFVRPALVVAVEDTVDGCVDDNVDVCVNDLVDVAVSESVVVTVNGSVVVAVTRRVVVAVVVGVDVGEDV